MTAFGDDIDGLKADKSKVQEKIDKAMADPNSKAQMTEARNNLKAAKDRKGLLISEKKALLDQQKEKKADHEKHEKDKKNVQSSMKFTTRKEIDDRIKVLQKLQETTTMTLNEEKKLIKDMDALHASKKFLVEYEAKKGAIDSVKEEKKTINEQIKAKDKEIDVETAKIEEIMNVLKAQNEKDEVKRGTIKSLFDERDAIGDKISAKMKERDAKRTEYREANDKWFNYTRATRAQKQLQYEADKKKREEEKSAYLAKVEEEEMKKIPYEAEQVLCDYLADFLERTYVTGGKSEDAGEGKTADVIPVSDDPFAGIKARNKKDVEAEEFFGKNKKKKKRERTTKKQDKVVAFTMTYDLIEQFSLVQMPHPTSIEQVPQSVKDLREKKDWYKQQPRGSVPTAEDIRKAKASESQKVKKPTAKKQAAFSLSSDDFVPLSESASVPAASSSWTKGQQPTGTAAAAASSSAYEV
jgi:hypothetical protein